MTNDDIREIIRLLLTEKPMVKYTKNDDVSYPDKLPHAPYGYYEIENCSMGPMFFEVCRPDKMEECDAPCVCVQTLSAEHLFYEPKYPRKAKDLKFYLDEARLYKDFIKAIQQLPRENSNLEPSEAWSRFFHFRDPDSKKKRLNERYLCARIIYDTMCKMIHGSNIKEENSKDNPGWQTVYSTLDDGYIEKIETKIMPYKNRYNQNGKLLSINISCINLLWIFKDCEDWVSHMMFGAYETLLKLAKNEHCIDCHRKNVPAHIKRNQRTDPDCKRCQLRRQVQFTRTDLPYTNLMCEIKAAHQKGA